MRKNLKKKPIKKKIRILADDDTPLTVSFNGVDYYINVFLNPIETTLLEFELIFSLLENSGSNGDLSMANLKAQTKPLADFVTWRPDSVECRTIDSLQDLSMYAGCLSVIGSGFCAAATAATEGATTVFCEATWQYTLSIGAADCFNGIADKVAKKIGAEASLQTLQLLAGINDPKLLEVLEQSLGIMCTDVKNNAVAP